MAELGLSQGLCLVQRHEQILEQICSLYQLEGDIELLSLHRIKNRFESLDVHNITRTKLLTELVRENEEYRTQWKNNWYCLTPSRLDNAIARTIDFLAESSYAGIATVKDKSQQSMLKIIMGGLVAKQETKIKRWFSDNYDNILYDKEAKIPYPVVRKMRESFRAWAFHGANPFAEPISTFMEEVAKESGLNPDDYASYQDIWEELKR